MLLINKRIELYKEYFYTLAKYSEEMKDEPEANVEKIAIDYAMDTYAYWIDVYDNAEIVGFLIVCPKQNIAECHPDADYTIAQTYVSPDHRNKGLMSKAIESFMYDHPGIYAYDIIRGNVVADKFWDKLWDRLLLNARRTYLPEVRADAGNIQLHGVTVSRLYEKDKKEK